jgi:hypothetical protein
MGRGSTPSLQRDVRAADSSHVPVAQFPVNSCYSEESTPVSPLAVASSLPHLVPTDATRARRNDLSGFDFRIRGTRYSCTAPCKEQAGNREHSFAPVFYTRRLVLGSDQARFLLWASSRQNARPLPALMLRSIAARRVCKGFNGLAALRCVSKHDGAPDHSSYPSRRAYARSRWRHHLACALLRMRTSMRLSPAHDVKQPAFFVPAARFCARVFASLLRSPQSRVGGAPRDVRVQRHPLKRAIMRRRRA